MCYTSSKEISIIIGYVGRDKNIRVAIIPFPLLVGKKIIYK